MANPLLADMGIPMIFMELPLMLLALLPVIAIEIWVVRKRLPLTMPQALWGIGAANIVSTLIGVPLASGLMLVLEFTTAGGAAYGLDRPFQSVVLQAAWLVPYEEDLNWLIPAALIVLVLPTCAISVVIENEVLKRCWPTLPIRQVKEAGVWANVASYAALIVLALGVCLANLPYLGQR